MTAVVDAPNLSSTEEQSESKSNYAMTNPMNFSITTAENEHYIRDTDEPAEGFLDVSADSEMEKAQNAISDDIRDIDFPPDNFNGRESQNSEKSETSAGNGSKDYWLAKLVDVSDVKSTADWEQSDPLPDPSGFGSDHCYEPQEYLEMDGNTRLLSMEQVQQLESCLLSNYEIESSKFPIIRTPPCYFIFKLTQKIQKEMPDVTIRSVRIMGGFSSFIMCHKFRFNDLDILFEIDFPLEQRVKIFEQLRGLILALIAELFAHLHLQFDLIHHHH